MTKKKPTRNKPVVPTSKTSTKKIFGKEINSELRIKNYKLSSLTDLREIDSYENIIKLTTMTLVTVSMLCQMRALRPDGTSALLDQLPSFKYYKKKIILDYPGEALAISLPSCLPKVVVFLPDEPGDLEMYLIALVDSLQGNEKFLEKVSEENLSNYISGHCTRILGILNSCPSSGCL